MCTDLLKLPVQMKFRATKILDNNDNAGDMSLI